MDSAVTGMNAALCAAGCILQYLQFQLRRSVDHIQRLRVGQTNDVVLIDAASQSHLELVTARGGNAAHPVERGRPHLHADGRPQTPPLGAPSAA
jgi:DNA mismatch repair ATPase MutS